MLSRFFCRKKISIQFICSATYGDVKNAVIENSLNSKENCGGGILLAPFCCSFTKRTALLVFFNELYIIFQENHFTEHL